ncbi:MAG: CVNH domain-containing protein [Cyanobacteriota bacterium]|nr:CVNH domain-containing protein [Cyanobacteriota bacterium]
MKRFIKTSAIFLIAAVASLSLFASNAWALGNFSQSCSNSSIQGSTLSSTCRTMNGSYKDTSINLNSSIENVDGSLVWQPDNFIETCRNTTLASSSVMTAECKTRDQRFVSTAINLDEHIANIDGTLKYE